MNAPIILLHGRKFSCFHLQIIRMKHLVKILLLAAFVLAVHFAYGWRELFELVRQFAESENSPWIFLVLAATCSVGFSLSACNFFAGAAFGLWYGWGLSLVGLLISSSLGYVFGRFFVPREYIEKLRLKLRLGDPDGSRMFQINFFVRVFPGIPYTMQNIVLGGMRSEFKMYMIVNMAAQGAIAFFGNLMGYLVAAETESEYYFIALGILILVLVAAHRIMRRFYCRAKEGIREIP